MVGETYKQDNMFWKGKQIKKQIIQDLYPSMATIFQKLARIDTKQVEHS